MSPRNVRLAHEIATRLDEANLHGGEGSAVLAMAMGIYVEGEPGSHREFRVINDTMFKIAQMTFDTLRAARCRQPGHG